MKKIITATFISVLLFTAAHAQTLNKKEAQQLCLQMRNPNRLQISGLE